MRLRRRKRPELVIPVPIVGPSPADMRAVKIAEERAHHAARDDDFLWGLDYTPPQAFIKLPRDLRTINALYNGIRRPREGENRPTITYDPAEATEQLLHACKMPQPK